MIKNSFVRNNMTNCKHWFDNLTSQERQQVTKRDLGFSLNPIMRFSDLDSNRKSRIYCSNFDKFKMRGNKI